MKTINLVEALERGLKEIPDDWDDSALHISDLGAAIEGEGCLRQVWYRINGYPRKENTPGKLWMFKQGHRIHELVPELLELPTGWRPFDVEIKTGLDGITGRYDLKLVKTGGDGPWITVIADFKTVRGNAFRYLDKPKPSHVAQLQGYLLSENADYGILLYIDREGQNGFLQFRVDRDDEGTKERCEILNALRGYSHPTRLPEPNVRLRENKNDWAIYVSSPWFCEYCDYRDISCPGAVPKDNRTDKVAAKVRESEEEDREYEYEWKEDYPYQFRAGIIGKVETLLQEEQSDG